LGKDSVTREQYEQLTPPQQAAFTAIGNALFSAHITCRNIKAQYPLICKEWIDQHDLIKAEDFAVALELWIPHLRLGAKAVVDFTEPEWLRYIPDYNWPGVDDDELYEERFQISLPLGMQLGAGAFGRVFRSGDIAVKYIDASRMTEFSTERHEVGESLVYEVVNAAVPGRGMSFATDTIVVRSTSLFSYPVRSFVTLTVPFR
jgi:hypothetical protein